MADDSITLPESAVGGQVQQLVESEGVTKVTCVRQGDGQWVISAE